MIWPVLTQDASVGVPGSSTPLSWSTALTSSRLPFLTRRVSGLDHGWKPLTRPTAVTFTAGMVGLAAAELAPAEAPATGDVPGEAPGLDRSEVNADTPRARPTAAARATTA